MIDNLALVMTTCDAYQDVAQHFFPILKKFWPSFDLKTYIITETKEINSEDTFINYIFCGNNKMWSERLIDGLKLIEEKYILFVMDDYYFGRMVDNQIFIDIVDFMQQNGIFYYNLKNKNKSSRKFKGKKIGYINKKTNYGVSLQAAVWEKDYLLNLINGLKCSAWEIENYFEKMLLVEEGKYFLHGACDLRNVLNIQNAVIKGKWVPSAIKFYRKYDYQIDTSLRGMLPFKDVFRQSFFTFFSDIIPIRLRKRIKKMLKKMGMKFVTD